MSQKRLSLCVCAHPNRTVLNIYGLKEVNEQVVVGRKLLMKEVKYVNRRFKTSYSRRKYIFFKDNFFTFLEKTIIKKYPKPTQTINKTASNLRKYHFHFSTEHALH